MNSSLKEWYPAIVSCACLALICIVGTAFIMYIHYYLKPGDSQPYKLIESNTTDGHHCAIAYATQGGSISLTCNWGERVHAVPDSRKPGDSSVLDDYAVGGESLHAATDLPGVR